MGNHKNQRKDLDTAREALASWRRSHDGRGRPIPAALWSDAADVAVGLLRDTYVLSSGSAARPARTAQTTVSHENLPSLAAPGAPARHGLACKRVVGKSLPPRRGYIHPCPKERTPRGVVVAVVTSQVPTKNCHEMLPDPAVADAICDRLVHNAHVLSLKGPSIRKVNGLGEKKEDQG